MELQMLSWDFYLMLIVEILKMKCDQDLCLNLWYDFKKLLWQDELNPWVRCAFGNVCVTKLPKFTISCHNNKVRTISWLLVFSSVLFDWRLSQTIWHKIATDLAKYVKICSTESNDMQNQEPNFVINCNWPWPCNILI